MQTAHPSAWAVTGKQRSALILALVTPRYGRRWRGIAPTGQRRTHAWQRSQIGVNAKVGGLAVHEFGVGRDDRQAGARPRGRSQQLPVQPHLPESGGDAVVDCDGLARRIVWLRLDPVMAQEVRQSRGPIQQLAVGYEGRAFCAGARRGLGRGVVLFEHADNHAALGMRAGELSQRVALVVGREPDRAQPEPARLAPNAIGQLRRGWPAGR